MTKKSTEAEQPLNPNQIVRYHEGYKYFGYRSGHMPEKIKAGEIPAPMSLSQTGRAKGWLGRQILDWQAQRMAISNQRKSDAA
jgi:predicted DNA-binding transcriptional regulator AlpA